MDEFIEGIYLRELLVQCQYAVDAVKRMNEILATRGRSLFQFLWEVFTGWSFVDGYSNTKGTGVDFFLSHGGATARLTWTRWVVRTEPDTIAATN